LARRDPVDIAGPPRLSDVVVRPSTSPLDRGTGRQYFVRKLASRLLVVVIVAAVVGFYSRYRTHTPESASPSERLESQPDTSDGQERQFRCDGRTYCSQMTSCAEAKYFLAHCPNVKMDGDHNGIPCERQWCPGG